MRSSLVGWFALSVLVLVLVWWSRGAREESPAPAVPVPQPELPSAEPSETTVVSAAAVELETTSRQETPPAPAQIEATAHSTAAPSLAHLRGRFLLPDGRPASGVKLRVIGWEGNSERVLRHGRPAGWHDLEGLTDPEGRFDFAFDPPLAFQFVLDATHRGHADVSWRWSELPARETTDLGDITLYPGGAVRGRIADAAGAPVGGKWRAYGESSASVASGFGGDATRVDSAVDELTGEFVLEGLPEGPAKLSAHSRIANWIEGPTVEVRAGSEVSATIVYRGPSIRDRITVTTFNRPLHVFSNPAPGSIVLQGQGLERVAKKIRNSSQSWTFDDVPPGVYSITIRDPVFEPWSEQGVTPGSAVQAQLRGSGAVALEVLDPAGRALDDYRLRIAFLGVNFFPSEFELRGPGAPLPEGGLYRGLIPAELELDSGFEPPAGVDPSAFKRKTPRSFELRVEAAGFGPGSATVEGLRAGETRAVRIELRAPTALSGRISGGAAAWIGDVSVLLADSELDAESALGFVEGVWPGPTKTLLETRTDPHGRFAFDALRAGTYVAFARFHHDFHAASAAHTLASGESGELILDVPAFGTIEGRVLAPLEDLRNGWVEAQGRGLYDPYAGGWTQFDGEPPPRAALDAEGRFTLAPLSANSYELSLRLSSRPLPERRALWGQTSGDARHLGEVAVETGSTSAVEFDLSRNRPGTLIARVTLDGEPAAGRNLRAFGTTSSTPPRNSSAHATTDADGRARFERVEPGDWRLALSDSERLWTVETNEALVLESGGTLTLNLDVVRYSGIVRVLDPGTGAARANASIQWRHAGGSSSVQTDSTGAVELRVPLGRYTLGARDASVEIEWTAGGPVPAEVRL